MFITGRRCLDARFKMEATPRGARGGAGRVLARLVCAGSGADDAGPVCSISCGLQRAWEAGDVASVRFELGRLLGSLEGGAADASLAVGSEIPVTLSRLLRADCESVLVLRCVARLSDVAGVCDAFVDREFLRDAHGHWWDAGATVSVATIWQNVVQSGDAGAKSLFHELFSFGHLRESCESEDICVVLCTLSLLKAVVKSGVDRSFGAGVLDLVNSLRPVRNDALVEPIFWVLFYLIQTDSVGYDDVSKRGFVSMVQSSLLDPTESSTIAACHLIGLMYRKYDIRYRFNVERLLTILVSERENSNVADSVCSAGLGALNAMINRLPCIIERLVEANVVDVLLPVVGNRSVSTKVSFLAFFDSMLVRGGESVCEQILDDFEPGRETILSLIADVTDTHQGAVVLRCFQIISRMFEVVSSINRGGELSEMFSEAFTSSKLSELESLVPDVSTILESIRCHLK